jgi:hypothetical protein
MIGFWGNERRRKKFCNAMVNLNRVREKER